MNKKFTIFHYFTLGLKVGNNFLKVKLIFDPLQN